MGYVTPNVECDGGEVLMLSQMAAISDQYKHFHIPAITLVLAYAAVSFIFVLSIFYAALYTKSTSEHKYPESEAWKRSFFDWLWMGWATHWIAKWGAAEDGALTKIKASEIPLSDPNDECE